MQRKGSRRMVDRVSEVREQWTPGELTNRELWRWRVEHTPDRRWLWFEGRTWTYGEFDADVRRAGRWPAWRSASSRARACWSVWATARRPSPRHLAVGQLGAVCVPLVPGMPFDELVYPIEHSEATVLIADEPLASLVRRAARRPAVA